MFTRGIRVSYVVIIAICSILAGGVFSAVIYSNGHSGSANVSGANSQVTDYSLVECQYNFPRLKGYRYIKPLLFAEQNCEADKCKSMKEQIGQLVQQLTDKGILVTASVYVRDFNEGAWICYNPDEKYTPASLLKLPTMLTYLRISEDSPGLLNQELFCEKTYGGPKTVNFPSDTIRPGHKYSKRQLLQSMIIHSDNNATQLLMDNLQAAQFTKTFDDLGLAAPMGAAVPYYMTVKDCSVFLKVLYNGTYLNDRNSDYANMLLTETDFNKGIVRGLPAGVKVAHKFGEGGDLDIYQLHETAIVYDNNTPYLITVMTKGRDMKRLPEALSSISGLVYNNMIHQATNGAIASDLRVKSQ